MAYFITFKKIKIMKKDDKKSQFNPQISKEDTILSGERQADTKEDNDIDSNELLKKRKGEPDVAAENLENNLDTWDSENSDKK